MFKLAKYYLLANIYKRAKVSVFVLLASVVGMVVVSLVFADLIAINTGSDKALMVSTKWILLFTLLGLIVLHLRKIVRSVSLPFGEDTSVVVDEKKERVMEKTKLRSRSDVIMDKYRKAG
jgi:uncharacterized metal-binding protein